MPDVWSVIAETGIEVQEQLASVLDTAWSDSLRQDVLQSFLAEIDFPQNARVLEVGSGTGAVVQAIAELPKTSTVLGVDPSPVLIQKARDRFGSLPGVTFQEMDGRTLTFPDNDFDAAIFHLTLCHVDGSEMALAEAFRVLRPGGILAIFDGDYATVTVALGENDPLQNCIEELKDTFLNDPWIVRRLPVLLANAGFELESSRSYGLMQVANPGAVLTQIDRGADSLVARGQIGTELASELKNEARKRVEAGRFYGFTNHGCFIARKPRQ